MAETFAWHTDAIINLDPTAPGPIVLPTPWFEVSNATLAAGDLSGTSPACGVASGCGTFPTGLMGAFDWGNGPAAINVTFGPPLSGKISVLGLDTSYYLSGSGNVWTGWIDGTNGDPTLSRDCDGTCMVQGHWVATDPAEVVEPSTAILLGFAILAAAVVRQRA